MQDSSIAIGLMSGTSLDGLDVCCVEFKKSKQQYEFEILATKTYPYNDVWYKKLKSAFQMSETELTILDQEFGKFSGHSVNDFILENRLSGKVDLIASHGQTIFHEPEKGITTQIGEGQLIADITGLLTINNFRIKDVQLGGQGAPLVPIGDRLLFGEYESCLNLGGIANISFEKNNERIAFDICPANLPLNQLMVEYFNTAYDKDGEMAAQGVIIEDLLNELNDLKFYRKAPPKSLGYEWMNQFFYPILQKYAQSDPKSLLKTVIEHEAYQIAALLNKENISNCLISGGGALNKTLVEAIQLKTTSKIIIAEKEILDFKEALIFAFLGFLNINNQINTLSSVTGAEKDSIGGFRFYPSNKS
ncbi:anhydro-N-acetylmuramic acid kinase [Paracrocinitomix mangrovi]|uniref:anhydro-N-acetylmuramic acid kinase n=1 Tax=Paracrocinitomix mangrovi TaxID=2862509 RepID=UPI001C8E9E12|nr:anhydro-N-acetylmuramic acid kinase [Paracrocinitomix mangrovi]UKN03217.1 anhydro-N-acetylmuramic acid kinase [Paracrocinitomix mangrovi]